MEHFFRQMILTEEPWTRFSKKFLNVRPVCLLQECWQFTENISLAQAANSSQRPQQRLCDELLLC
jgi:hypothetical protein